VKRLVGILVLMAMSIAAHGAGQAAGQKVLAISYHDVVERASEIGNDRTTITVDQLINQLAWLDAHGFEPITLDQWVAAAEGEPLPPRPVLLTFDDGYASFAEHVMPVLKLFDFPAVLAPVTSWVDAPPGGLVQYGDEQVSRGRFLTWDELREIAASGLVEIASHSHDLHRGLEGNAFGNELPAAVARVWDRKGGAYEPEDTYETRLHRDLARSRDLIAEHLGKAPRTIVWPYGAYNLQGMQIARSLGMQYTFTLDSTGNDPRGDVRRVHRKLVGVDTSMLAFTSMALDLYQDRPLRAAHVDLDYIYDPDPTQAERNLGQLLDRIKAMKLSFVFLQGFADPDGDGVADSVYFPNRHLPVRADLFNRVAWQLKTRAGVEVFAWMPVMAFELPDPARNEALAVKAYDDSHESRYHRLSPYHPEARRIVREIYDDLGRGSRFLGVLYHDDGFLTDREDVNPAALAGLDSDGAASPGDGRLPVKLSDARGKTRFLIDFTHELSEVLRRHQPALLTARNIYARPVMDPAAESWFAQSLGAFQRNYDYTAIMAMPYLEQADDPEAWLADLVEKVKATPGGMERTVFELQTVDWRLGNPVRAATLANQMDLLLDRGVKHIAYYPDDFIQGYPPVPLVRSRLSVNYHPALEE
jgi:biofilm PGA synthesis lipoprotein PgaB